MWNFVFFARRQITDACLFVGFFCFFFFCFFFFQGWSYRPNGARMLQEGSFWRKWQVLVPFLSDEKLEGTWTPPTHIFSPKLPDQNFEIAILFNLVENSINMYLGTTWSPTVPGGGDTSYKLWPFFTYSKGYYEVYRRFHGDFFALGWKWVGRRGYVGGSFHGEILSRGKRVPMKGAQDFLALFKKKTMTK